MRFTTSASELLAALQTARQATPATPTLVAYGGILLHVKSGRLNVIGSDGETTIAAQVTVADAVDGQVLLPPKPLVGYLSTIDGTVDVQISADETGDVVAHPVGRSPYRFRPIPATFALPPAVRSSAVETDWSRLAAALKAVRASVSKEQPGVQLVSGPQGLAVHATDSYRLARAVLAEGGFGEFSGIVDLGVLERVARHGVSSVAVDQKARSLRCAGDGVTVSVRLMAVQFPSVEGVMAQRPSTGVDVPSVELRRKLASLAAVAESEPLQCRIEDGVLELKVDNLELGAGRETVEVVGKVPAPFEFSVHLPFLADAVDAHPAGQVRLSWSSPLAPLFLTSDGDLPVSCIVMPVRV